MSITTILSFHNWSFENGGASLNAGTGMVTLIPCPGVAVNFPQQLAIDMTGGGITASVAYSPLIAVNPPNDAAVGLSLVNFQMGLQTSPHFFGIPALSRADSSSQANPRIPLLTYSYQNASQTVGNFEFSQLYQDAVAASAFMYSDTAFAALPNATTLYAGQILAPPTYWNGANGKRYALDVVYTAGTTGTPNAGGTTCTAPGGTNVMICSSATDLSYGQFIDISTSTNRKISGIDASNATAVVVTSSQGNFGTFTNATLNFHTPVLGPEIQLPTKSAAAPTTLAWSQGDIEQNSGATANGVAGWVATASGTGTAANWVGIPLQDANGNLPTTQIAAPSSSTNPVCPNGPNNTLTTSGCSASTGTPSVAPAWLQYLGTGTDGAYSCATGTCTKSGGVYNYTTFNVSSGATLNYNTAYAVVYVTGACTINGTIGTAISGGQGGGNAGGGGSGGGGGGGTAAGTAGTGVGLYPGLAYGGTYGVSAGGTAGTSSGGTGGGGNSLLSTAPAWYSIVNSGASAGYYWTGAPGGAGGSSGGAGGYEGGGFTLICGSITGTGTINMSGQAGGNSTANNVGAGGGGGGGPIVLSSQAAETYSLTLTNSGGAGGSCLSFTGCGVGGTGGAGAQAKFSGW